MVLFGVDALRFHRPTLSEPWLSQGSAPTSILLLIELVTLLVIVGSFALQVHRLRLFRSRLPTQEHKVYGTSVLVIPSRRAHAFCLGFLRPRVVISDGLLGILSERELRSVIAHELHHARRRDPLRRALIKALCDGFWFIPALRDTARTYAEISELAADAVAVRDSDSRFLASALIAFEEHGGDHAGASPERVSHLLGTETTRSMRMFGIGPAAAVLLALAGGTIYLLRPVPAELCLPLSTALGTPLVVLTLGLACLPAGWCGRNAARYLRATTADPV